MGAVTITTGAASGTVVEITDAVLFGRENTTLGLDDSAVSRRHAFIRPVDDELEVEDLGSANGTTVNGERISSATRLHNGDVIKIGATVLTVSIDARVNSDATRVLDIPAGKTVVMPQPSPAARAAAPATPVAPTPSPATPIAAPAAPAAPAPVAPPLAPVAVAIAPPPFAPVAPRRRGIASRRALPTVYTISVIVLTAVALILYFALR